MNEKEAHFWKPFHLSKVLPENASLVGDLGIVVFELNFSNNCFSAKCTCVIYVYTHVLVEFSKMVSRAAYAGVYQCCYVCLLVTSIWIFLIPFCHCYKTTNVHWCREQHTGYGGLLPGKLLKLYCFVRSNTSVRTNLVVSLKENTDKGKIQEIYYG